LRHGILLYSIRSQGVLFVKRLVIVTVMLCVVTGAWAQSPKLRFKAKRHSQDLTTNIIELEGHVEVQYLDNRLEAGFVRIDKNNFTVVARDHVRLSIPSEDTEVKAHEIHFNYKEKTGEFINAVVVSGFSRLRAKKITKVGPKKYEMYKGSYTTCQVGEDEACPWKILTHRAKVELGGYATASHPVFLVQGVPIFYSPFLFFPVKNERQSGLLFPEFGVSDRSGFRLRNALFLALGRSHDSTLGVEYLSKRGLKYDVEYRYQLDGLSSGKLNVFMLRDRKFEEEFGKRNRFAVSFVQQYFFKPNLFNKADIQVISDEFYVQDFDLDIRGREDAGLEAKLLQGYNLDNFSFNLEGVFFRKLLSPSPTDSNQETTHKLPEFKAVAHQTSYFNLPFQMGGDLSFVNFASEAEDFLDKNGNETFDQGVDEIIRAQRLDVFPKVSMAFNFKPYFEWLPQVGFRETHWWLPLGFNKNRQIFDFLQTLRTNFGRIFNYDGEVIKKIKHIVEPSVVYHYSPFIKKDEGLPAFDDIDDISTTNLLTYSLSNRFIFKRVEKDASPFYFDGIRFDLSQDFDVLEQRRNGSKREPFGDLKTILSSTLTNFSMSTEADFAMYGDDRLVRLAHQMAYRDPFSNSYSLNYTLIDQEDGNSLNALVKLGFLEVLKFDFFINYSFEDDVFLKNIYRATYFPPSKCWALDMTFEDSRDKGFSLNVGVNLLFGQNLLSFAGMKQQGLSKSVSLFPDKEREPELDPEA